MAQLKDTVIAGSLRATEGVYTNEIQCTKLKALTSASATTNYGVGTNGQILMSNGTNAYWSSNIPTATTGAVGGIKLGNSTTYDDTNNILNVQVAAANNIAYVSLPLFSTTRSGLVPKPDSADITKFLCSDGNWRTVSTSGTTNTKLTHATTGALGGIKLYSTDLSSGYYRLKLSNNDQAYVQVPTFSTTAAGLVPAPTSASNSTFLCSTGSWVTIDTSGSGSGSGTTSISAATESALGGIKLYASNETPSTGYKLSLSNDYKAYVVIPTATSGVKGLVSIGAQTFGGKKTFEDGLEIGDQNTEPSQNIYKIYGAGEITGLLTIHSDSIQITNSNDDNTYCSGKPYRTAIQIGSETSTLTGMPYILISEYAPNHLQIRAQSLLLGENPSYLPYSTSTSTSYSKDAIVWKNGTFYVCTTATTGGAWSLSNWQPINKTGVICDANLVPFLSNKHSLGDSTNSWNALYLNGYKIQCTANGLTITSAS